MNGIFIPRHFVFIHLHKDLYIFVFYITIKSCCSKRNVYSISKRCIFQMKNELTEEKARHEQKYFVKNKENK